MQKLRELYERHVPEGARDIISTTVTGAAIGAGTALAGKIFQKVGAMPTPPQPPIAGAGYAQREQYRRSNHYQTRSKY